jgi:hypothetical protein
MWSQQVKGNADALAAQGIYKLNDQGMPVWWELPSQQVKGNAVALAAQGIYKLNDQGMPVEWGSRTSVILIHPPCAGGIFHNTMPTCERSLQYMPYWYCQKTEIVCYMFIYIHLLCVHMICSIYM